MELDQLLQELSNQPPCGEDMSFSPEFDEIQELRRQDDPTIAQGEWVTTLKTADWPGVLSSTGKILSQRSKDLRVAGWWTEASAHVNSYGGLADGLRLARELCERYWDALHPRLEGSDAELRVGSLTWLLGQVNTLATALPVLQRGDLVLSLADIEAARTRSATTDHHSNDPSAPAKPNADTVAKALRETPSARIAQMRDDSLRAQTELAQLQAVVDAQLGVDGPGFTAARRALEQAFHGLERLARDAGVGNSPAADAAHAPDTPPGQQAAASTATGGSLGGAPATRAQALAQLRVVADFFRRTEPHSPVAYLADKAARWGDMPLHVWLRTVMKDPGAITQLEEMLGVEPPPSGDNAKY
ncbi:MAG: type VI secretion system protein TssA [Burkholderiales bacterium]|nr:type VI secretion system protein TssA [Burkholderiales bacterium]